MSADDLRLNIEIDANDYKQNLKDVNKLLAENARNLISVTEKFDGFISEGNRTSTTVKKLIEGFGYLTTTTKTSADGIDTTTLALVQSTAEMNRFAAAQEKARQAEESNAEAKARQARVNAAHARAMKELNAGELEGVKAKKRSKASNDQLVESYEVLNKQGNTTVYTFTRVKGKLTEVAKETIDSAEATRRLAAEEAKANEERKKVDRVQKGYKRTLEEITSGKLKDLKISRDYNSATKKTTERYTGINEKGEQVVITHKKVGKTVVDVDRSTRTLNQSLKDQNNTLHNVVLSWKSMIRLIGVQLAHRAIAALVRGVREGLSEAIELEKRIAEIQTISQDVPQSFEQWADGIRSVSDAFGFDILDAAEASYQALSNQVAKGAETFNFMTDAANFAIVTNSSLTDSVNLLSSALNSYDKSSIYAEQTSAELFRTIELGRIRSSEIANTLGRVTVVASELGIELAEVNALQAQTSVRGINANQALTQIRGTMNALLKPTEAMKDFFKELGVATGEQAVAAYGLTGIFREMSRYTDGNSQIIAKLVPRVRGLTTTLIALKDEGEAYGRVLAQLQESQENYQKAIQLATDNSGRQLTKLAAQVKNVFINDIGRDAVKGIVAFLSSIDELEYKIKRASAVIVESFKTISSVLLRVSTLDDIASGVLFVYGLLEDEDEKLKRRREKAIDDELRATRRQLVEQEKLINDYNKERTRSYTRAGTDIIASLNKVAEENKGTFEKLGKALSETFKGIEKTLDDTVKVISSSIKEANDNIKKLADDSISATRDIRSAIFDEALSRQNLDQQFRTIKDQIARVEKLRLGAIKDGNIEESKLYLNEKIKLTKKLIDIDKERGTTQEKIDKELSNLKLKREEDRAKAIADLNKARTSSAAGGITPTEQRNLIEKQKETNEKLLEIDKEYKDKSRELLKERTGVDDASIGEAEQRYKQLWENIIKDIEAQKEALQKSEQARIKRLEEQEKAALFRVSVFRQKLAVFESFDIKDTESKTAEQIEKIAKDRQDALSQLQIEAGVITDKSERTAVRKQIEELKTLETQELQNKALAKRVEYDLKILDIAKKTRDAKQQEITAEINAIKTQLSELGKAASFTSTNRTLAEEQNGGSQFIATSLDSIVRRARLAVEGALSSSSITTLISDITSIIPLLENTATIVELENFQKLLDASSSQAQRLRELNDIRQKALDIIARTPNLQDNVIKKEKTYLDVLMDEEAAINRILEKRNQLNLQGTVKETPALQSQLISVAQQSPASNQPSNYSVNVGDVNVNVRATGNTQVDAQAIGKALNRGIRQGIIDLPSKR